MKYLTKKNLLFFTIILIFVSGFYLRLIEYLKFDYLYGDEGNHFLLFDNFLRFKKFWITGEGSSLGNEKLDLHFHNLPYSLYFQLIIFILAIQSPLIYIFLYILLSLLIVYFLWQTSKNFFNEKTGLLTLFFASFSHHLIDTSTFASQPFNAVFFEAFGLFLLSLFYKRRKKQLLIFSLLSFLLALHMYTPMFLFLPIKIIFILILFHKEITKNIKILFYSLLIIIASYLPMIINEFNYFGHWSSNLTNVQKLIENGGFEKTIDLEIMDQTNYLTNKMQNFSLMIKRSVSNINMNFHDFRLFFYIIILLSIFLIKDKTKKIFIYYLVFSILTPIFLLDILYADIPELINSRVYLFSTVVYVILLFSISIAHIRVLSINLSRLVIFLVIVLILTNMPLEKGSGEGNFFKKQIITQKIIKEINRNNLSLNEINLFVLNDKFGNWDSSIYWYLIQKNSDTQLIDISYPFLNPTALEQEPKITFFICENYTKNLQTPITCLHKIEKDYENYFELEKEIILNFDQFILVKVINQFQS